MEHKVPTKKFMIISNWNNPFDPHGFYKKLSVL